MTKRNAKTNSKMSAAVNLAAADANALGRCVQGTRAVVIGLGLMALSACAHNANSTLALQSIDAVEGTADLVDLGDAAADRGDHATAIQYYRTAHGKRLAYARSEARPLIGLGTSLMAVGQYGDAAEVFIKAANANGGAPALRGLARAQLHLGQPGLAVESARSAIQMDPDDAASMAVLGVSLDVLGDHQGASATYANAMERFPGSLSLAANYGLSMVMAGDYARGISMLEDIVRDPRAGGRDRQNLAISYALAGEYDKAATLAAIDLDVEGVRGNLQFADMLRAMNPRARLSALVLGATAPKTDFTQNANAVYVSGDNAAWVEASVRRLVPRQVDLAGVPALMDPNGWAVQIAAYRKIEHLAPGWAYLSSKYASILQGLEPRRSEVNHPPAASGPVGFFYRLNAGPLTGRAQAMAICDALKARVADCWVRPPTASEGRLPDEGGAGFNSWARNEPANAAEEAMTGSKDYNAVVNQFARALVSRNRTGMEQAPVMPVIHDEPAAPVVKQAAATTQPMPAPMKDTTPQPEPVETASVAAPPVQSADMTPARVPDMPDFGPALAMGATEPKAEVSPALDMMSDAVETARSDQPEMMAPAALENAAPVIFSNARDVPGAMLEAAEQATELPGPPAAALALAPAHALVQEAVLDEIFNAVLDAEKRDAAVVIDSPPANLFAVEEAATAEAAPQLDPALPKMDKVQPALPPIQRFNMPSSQTPRLTGSGQIIQPNLEQSGTVRDAFDAASKPKDPVNGVY